MNTINQNYAMSRRTIAYTGVLSALGFLLMILELPWPLSGFLKLDFSDVVVLVAAQIGGIYAAVGVAIMKSLLLFLFHGSSSAGVGNIAAIIASLAFVSPFYCLRRQSAIIIGVASVLSLTVVMVLMNYFWITPFFANLFHIQFILNVMQKPSEFLFWCATLYGPFNIAKGTLDIVLFFILKTYIPALNTRGNQ